MFHSIVIRFSSFNYFGSPPFFEKCVYSLGDVDRNGVVDSTDSLLILKYSLGMGTGNAIDEAAFKLAADVNLDGDVDIMDVNKINKYLNGQTTL